MKKRNDYLDAMFKILSDIETVLIEIEYSLFLLTSLIYAEKLEFENSDIMEDKQRKQTE